MKKSNNRAPILRIFTFELLLVLQDYAEIHDKFEKPIDERNSTQIILFHINTFIVIDYYDVTILMYQSSYALQL